MYKYGWDIETKTPFNSLFFLLRCFIISKVGLVQQKNPDPASAESGPILSNQFFTYVSKSKFHLTCKRHL